MGRRMDFGTLDRDQNQPTRIEQENEQQQTEVLPNHARESSAAPPSDPPQTPQQVLTMQRRMGNAATQRMIQRRTAVTPADQLREQAQLVTGYDLSGVNIQPDSPLARAAGVEAVTIGSDIHFGPGAYDPATAHGQHVLAHEYAHVAQQAGGETADLDSAARYDALETQAERGADAIHQSAGSTPENLKPLSAPTRIAAQAFDPRYHRQALVEGLEESGFSDEEVGMIYAANWERDFSQAHPALNNVVLAWKQCKVAAFEGKLSESHIAGFEGSIDALLNPSVLSEIVEGKAYGGYRFYEHMDKPLDDATNSTRTADVNKAVQDAIAGGRLPSTPPGVPPHVLISREYIKTQLYEAAREYRHDKMGTGGVGATTAANFDKMKKAVANVDAGQTLPGGEQPVAIAGKEAAIESQQTRQAKGIASPAASNTQGTFTATVGDHLGRASHALEDFFAHSNFVELAIDFAIGKKDPKAPPPELTTGTFGSNDSMHSLAHKVRGLADEIDAEIPLVNRIAGRTDKNPDPSQVNVGSKEHPANEAHDPESQSWWEAIKGAGGEALKGAGIGAGIGGVGGLAFGGPLGALAGAIGGGAIGGLAGLAYGVHEHLPEVGMLFDIIKGTAGGALLGGLGGAAVGSYAGAGPLGVLIGGLMGAAGGGWLGFKHSIKSSLRNVIATPRGVNMLRRVAEMLEERTREKAKSEPGSHTALAKDQPGHDEGKLAELRNIKFEMAHACAKAADKAIVGKMRDVLEAPSAEAADTALKGIYDKLEGMIQMPSASHDFAGILNEKMEAAKKAYLAYQQEQASGGGDHDH